MSEGVKKYSKLYYLIQAQKMAELDLKEVKERIDRWVHVDTEDRAAIDEWLENHRKGYNGDEDIKKQVEIEFALQELSTTIYLEKRRLGIKE